MEPKLFAIDANHTDSMGSARSQIAAAGRPQPRKTGPASAPVHEHLASRATNTSWERFRRLAVGMGETGVHHHEKSGASTRVHSSAYEIPRSATGHGFELVRRKTRVTEDYYMLLRVRREATSDELERAYRQFVWRVHPDRFYRDPERREQSERKLRGANVAMQTLRDPKLRAEYDAARLYA